MKNVFGYLVVVGVFYLWLRGRNLNTAPPSGYLTPEQIAEGWTIVDGVLIPPQADPVYSSWDNDQYEELQAGETILGDATTGFQTGGVVGAVIGAVFGVVHAIFLDSNDPSGHIQPYQGGNPYIARIVYESEDNARVYYRLPDGGESDPVCVYLNQKFQIAIRCTSYHQALISGLSPCGGGGGGAGGNMAVYPK